MSACIELSDQNELYFFQRLIIRKTMKAKEKKKKLRIRKKERKIKTTKKKKMQL